MNRREIVFRVLVGTTRLLRRTAKVTGRLAQRFRPPPQRIRDLFPVMTANRQPIEYHRGGPVYPARPVWQHPEAPR